jgi:flagellar FliJ protein
MTDFRFRLASLMRLRESERDERREALAQAFRADQVLQQNQESIQTELHENQRQVQHCVSPGPISVERLLGRHRYELVLQTQLRQLQRQRQSIAAEIERRRQALVEADRELKILEKLRERHWQEYTFQQQKNDLRQLDEIALRRTTQREVESL